MDHVKLTLLLISGLVGWGFSGGVVTAEPASGASPPDLPELIRKVRARNDGLDRAVVQITPDPGTPDGGGRLYWKRNRFVRTRTYRLQPGGRLHLYDGVTRKNGTSFLFHTIRSDGRSFTYALQHPFQNVPDSAYGLLDYVHLHHVLDRGVDVRYPGFLMTLNLFPQRLSLYENRYSTSFHTENNTRYILLQRRKIAPGQFYFSETLYLNPTTWRFEKVVLKERARRHVLSATSFHSINGVSLPRSVRVSSPGTSDPFPYTFRYRVRRNNLEDTSVQPPSWLNDPGLPVVRDISTKEIHRKIRENRGDASLFRNLMQSAIRHRSFFRFPFHRRAFESSLQNALKKHPDSTLVPLFLDGIQSHTRPSRDRRPFITRSPEIRTNVRHPYMNYAAAYRALRQKNIRQAERYLKPVRNTFPYGHARRRFQFLHDLRTADTSTRIRSVIDTYFAGVRPSGQIDRVHAFDRLVPENDKQEWINAMESAEQLNSSPLLLLALARYYAERDNIRRANRHYGTLADLSTLRPQLISYVQSAGQFAKPVIQKLEPDPPLVWVLLHLAVENLRSGQADHALKRIDRILTLLQQADHRATGHIPRGKENTYLSKAAVLIRRLGPSHAGKMRKLALQLINHEPLTWNNARFIQALRSLTNNNRNARFRMARALLLQSNPDAAGQLLSSEDLRKELEHRLTGGNEPLRNAVALARWITFHPPDPGEYINRWIQQLKRIQTERAGPANAPVLLDALGSLYMIRNDLDPAASAFEQALKIVQSHAPPEQFETLFRSLSVKRLRSALRGAPIDVDAGDPLIVKLARVLKQSGAPSGSARQTLSRYAPLDPDGTASAVAFKTLGLNDRALQVLVRRFRNTSDQKHARTLMDLLVNILRERERYVELATIYLVASREKQFPETTFKKKYRTAKKKIDQGRLVREIAQMDHGTPRPRTRKKIDAYLRNIERSTRRRETMKYVSRIMNMRGKVAAALLEHRNADSTKRRTVVRNILGTLRIRQIQRSFLSGRMRPDALPRKDGRNKREDTDSRE